VTENNEKAKQEILSMLNEDDMPVVFIGAGLSRPPYLLWSDLINKLASRIGYPSLKELSTDPLEDTSRLKKYNESEFNRAIINEFVSDPDTCSPALQSIAKINFKAFLTTNVDRGIERAFRLEKRQCQLYSSASTSRLLSSLCCSQNLFFLHGRVNPHIDQNLEIVFTREEYEQAYFGYKGHVGSFLFDVFSQNNVVFTGFSLNKHEPINYVLESIIRVREHFKLEKKMRTWRILLSCNSIRNEETVDRLKRVGIETISFDQGDDSFSGLNWIWTQVAEAFRLRDTIPFELSPDPIARPNNWRG